MQPCPGSYEGKPHELIPLDSPDLDEVCYNCTSTECRCNLIAKVRQHMLDKCIAVVEHHFGPEDYELRWLLDGEAVLDALRALQEK